MIHVAILMWMKSFYQTCIFYEYRYSICVIVKIKVEMGHRLFLYNGIILLFLHIIRFSRQINFMMVCFTVHQIERIYQIFLPLSL